MPKGMIYSTLCGCAVCLMLFFAVWEGNLITTRHIKIVVEGILVIGAVVFAIAAVWMTLIHRAFSYDGRQKMAKRIIEGVSEQVILPIEGRGLDVGCGSGALAIAVAKLNPRAEVVGVDRWGIDYASYSKTLCEQNAQAEGVVNVVFAKGDALQLDFEDESFDAVFSNYVYHNIRSRNRQDILLETLRVLKKGGLFVIHDIFSWANYGNMQQFLQQLKEMGYERAELIDTTDGFFMSKWEASWMMLDGSAILVGKK